MERWYSTEKRRTFPSGNGVLDHIPVQAGIPFCSVRPQARREHIRCGSSAGAGIGGENRCAGETDVVRFGEMPVDIPVHLSELGTVAFINDENHLFVPVGVHHGLIAFGIDGVGHLLDGGDDQLPVGILQVLNQHFGAVRLVHAVLFEGIVFIHGLVVQVLPVDKENHLVDPGLHAQQLRQLEGGQRFAGSGAGKDIAVLVGLQHAAAGGLHGVNLIGPHDHQDRLGGFDDHVFVDHLRQGRAVEELSGELVEGVDALVIHVRPEEHQALQDRIIGSVQGLVFIAEILGLDGIGDHKDLQITEKSPEGETAIAVDLIDRFIDLHAGALQLDLHQGQTVDQHRHIIAVLIGHIILVVLIHGDLMGHLIDIPVQIGGEEIQVHGFAVVQRQHILIPQDFCRFIHRFVFHMDQHPLELRIFTSIMIFAPRRKAYTIGACFGIIGVIGARFRVTNGIINRHIRPSLI